MKKKKLLKSALSLLLLACVLMSLVTINAFATEANTENKVKESETKTEEKENVVVGRQVCVTTDEKETPVTQEQVTKFAQAPTVDPLSGLKVEKQTTASISVSWSKLEGVTGYNVYYKNHREENFHYIYSTTTKSVNINNLDSGTKYDIMVAPYIEVGPTKYEGTSQTICTLTRPKDIHKLKLKRSSSVIAFKWEKIQGATGYEIYRKSYKDSKPILYDVITNPNTTKYSDKKVEAGRGYLYKIRPYISFKEDTYYGSFAKLQAISGLHAPEIRSIKTQLSRITITWEKIPYADGYDILYSTSKDGAFQLLQTTTSTYLNSKRLKSGVYYFRIQPFVKFGKNKIAGTYNQVYKTVSKKAYGVDVGDTYIEVSIDEQVMLFFLNGECNCVTDVVTGNTGGRDTPKGCYRIYQKSSPAVLVGEDYRTTVTYWLGFTYSGCGIHDASWRGSFGGNIYTYDGSHGCVNTPTDKVRQIYEKAQIGMYVVVY